MDVRCEWRKFAEINLEEQWIEFRCKSGLCGHSSGVIVIHRFSLQTGKLIRTERFAETRKEGSNDSPGYRTSVRSS